MENNSSRTKTKELVLTALMAVLITVCSWIQIPAAVPFTLQTFAVFVALELLGGRNGLLSVTVYILLGLMGVPVFSGFKGGAGVLLGTTGGYIIGFIFLALVYWLFEKIPTGSKRLRLMLNILALIAGTAVCYTFGTVWFMHVYTAQNGAVELAKVLKWCVTPFILIDLAKMAASLLLTSRIKKYVNI